MGSARRIRILLDSREGSVRVMMGGGGGVRVGGRWEWVARE